MGTLSFGMGTPLKFSLQGDKLVQSGNWKLTVKGNAVHVENCPHGHYPQHGVASVVY